MKTWFKFKSASSEATTPTAGCRNCVGSRLWCLRFGLGFCMALFCFPLAVNAAKDYVLTNGVITLADRPPESLAGTFRLGDELRFTGQHGEITYFELLALEFHSASASFTLRTASLVFFTNSEGAPTSDFTADVNAVGLTLPTVRLRSSGVGGLLSISDTNETRQLGTMSFLAVE